VLDHLPKAGATDLRKNRSIFNNIILTSTGAAQALAQVLPEMGQIPFIAESVRIPVSTGSLIILVISFQEVPDKPWVDREQINNIYRRYSAQMPRGYLHYTEEQNVSNDIIGLYRVAATIEGKIFQKHKWKCQLPKQLFTAGMIMNWGRTAISWGIEW
jgi:glyceraldehyde 3-phosphate dehydrogenase